MGYPLWDLLGDLAIARGGRGGEADSDGRYLRGRIAGVAWIPGLGLALLLGGWTGSWVVGVVTAVLILFSLYLFAVRPHQVAAFIRRRIGKTP